MFKLGRISPTEITDLGKAMLLQMSDGRRQLVPKFGPHYRTAKLPPTEIDYTTKALPAIKRMYRNDVLGCCVVSAIFHAYGIWSGNDTNTPIQGTDTEVDNAYSIICGPGDNGCYITDVLDYAVKTGIKLNKSAHKLDGYVAFDWSNKIEVQTIIYLFGGCDLGINLPQAWYNAGPNAVWDVPTGTGAKVIGGHCIQPIDYNADGVHVSTWGGIALIKWPAFLHKATRNGWGIEEAYAELAPLWYGNDNLAPCGVNIATLVADLKLIGSGSIPSIPSHWWRRHHRHKKK